MTKAREYGGKRPLSRSNDKIWLQQNTTDIDVDQELLEMGILKEDIVLGLHPAYKLPYTGYDIA